MKDMHIDLVVVERDPCGVLIWFSHCLVVVWLGVAMLLAAASVRLLNLIRLARFDLLQLLGSDSISFTLIYK